MTTETAKSLGQAIDEIVNALQGLEASSRLTAIRAACDHLDIVYGGEPAKPAPASHDEGGRVLAPPDILNPGPLQRIPLDIRSLKEQKSPSNSSEMACVVAYYLQYVAPESERKMEVGNDDLETHFRHADFPIPTRLDNVLINAKEAGYFDSVRHGVYKLNAVGYNLVVHSLPRSAKSTNRIISRQTAKRGSSKNSVKKAARPK